MNEPYIYLTTEIRKDPYLGTALITEYWTDGRVTERVVPKYALMILRGMNEV